MKIKDLQDFLAQLDPELEVIWTNDEWMRIADAMLFRLSDGKLAVLIRPNGIFKGDGK